MRKFLLLLGLFPVCVMAEHSQCYELAKLEQLIECYEALGVGDNKDIEAEAFERLEHWHYGEKKDEMRNQSTYFAALNSKKSDIGLGLADIFLRSRSNKNSIYFNIKDDIFRCNGECSISIKIDNNAILELQADEGAKANTIFIKQKNIKKLLGEIKNGKKMIVELPIYDKGKQQFKFNIEGLKWEHF